MDRKKILIIDDESAFAEMVKLNLEESGRFLVQCESNPHDAVQSALSFFPDLILLDVIMPDIEGPDVVAKFRDEPLLRNIPIIFLTATIRKDEILDGGGLIGGHVFIAKPCSVNELISAINSQL